MQRKKADTFAATMGRCKCDTPLQGLRVWHDCQLTADFSAQAPELRVEEAMKTPRERNRSKRPNRGDANAGSEGERERTLRRKCEDGSMPPLEKLRMRN